ncbi:MAG TPA: DUF1294 domain-containing protein [Candidatus Faecousia intestinigallinarum]|nr:DUF1294 domain-containing protein [Candidatus Faecousia intestinigallinarum]
MKLFLLVYLLLINALGFALMLADKQKARKKKWRVPEAALLGVAALGGSVGTLAGMYLVRHKTRHQKFTWGVPMLLALQILLAICLLMTKSGSL